MEGTQVAERISSAWTDEERKSITLAICHQMAAEAKKERLICGHKVDSWQERIQLVTFMPASHVEERRRFVLEGLIQFE